MSSSKGCLVKSLVPGSYANYFQISNFKGWLINTIFSYLYVSLVSEIYIAGILREKNVKSSYFIILRRHPSKKIP